MRQALTIICSLFFVFQAVGQEYVTKKTASAKQLKIVNKAQDNLMKGAYEKANADFDKVLKQEPRFIDVYLYKADALRNLNRYEEAENSFKKVIEMDPGYKPKVFYALAKLQERMEKYGEAHKNYETYLTYPFKDKAFKEKIKRFSANAKFADHALKNPKPFTPKNMGSAINSDKEEYWPSISIDGQTFIFTRRTGNNEDFFQSNKKDGKWQPAFNIGPPINTSQNEGAQTISADGQTMAYTVCNRKGDYGKCDIYISRKTESGKWSMPENIGAPINSSKWESQPSLSADGKTILFTRGSANHSQDKDIYGSILKDDGTWIKPIKMPPAINTPYPDESPFLHPDGLTIYFVSEGHPGMGKSDIFLSRKQPDGSWSQAENLGYPINSKDHELGMIVNFEGTTGYFSSAKEGGNGKLDIYEFPLPKSVRPAPVTYVKATVIDAETKEPLTADLELMNLTTEKTHTKSKSNKNGEFIVSLPMQSDYSLNVSKTGYLFHSENFALKGIHSFDEPYLLEIELQKIPPKIIAASDPAKPAPTVSTPPPAPKPIILKNVFFETASAELLPVSITELNKLRDLLNEHSTMYIQLNGHTDNVGTDSDNMILSDNRAKSVREYLVGQGIGGHRMTAKGFGEHSPIDTNDTKEGRANNRRTEFLIISR